ncbi:AI-2E family transporter [Stieleria varia]|uniref:AI-2 transport protein TqsA n=1 Tax=Stieleria varia TaxID=2528005 RepID=A0A5C5ZVC0_9BACT|nr:AI-2E family transporter [Stieleria varia]TWT91504.1 AI-2 transport protein TqsA [Stieleria varia]
MPRTKADLATLTAVAQLLAVVLIVAALFFARDVFIPLALGLLLSFLLSPIVNRLQNHGIPNVMAVVATAALAFVLLAGVFTMIGRELTTLVGDLPRHKQELVTKARGLAGMTSGVGGKLGELASEVTEAMETETDSADSETSEPTILQEWTDRLLPETTQADSSVNDGRSTKTPLYVKQVQDDLPLANWATTAGTVLGPLATAGLVTVFALFMLIHREDLRDRIIAVISNGNYVTTTEALDEAANRISRYLIAQSIINTSYGIVLSIGLAVIGATLTESGTFPNVVLWGVLAACLRFVPYLGPTAAAVFPAAMALSVFPGYSVFIAVVVLITFMELISNNVLEPWLYGSSTGISAVAVIVAAVFWAWLWGPVGLLLSTPLTVCLVVLGHYVPRFRVIAILLGEELEIKTSMRFYQRLLAGDERRAREILKEHANDHGFAKTCDRVLIPVLKRIRVDHESEHLDESDTHRLFAMVGGLIDELNPDKQPDQQSDASPETLPSDDAIDARPTVIGCTSHHFSETMVLNMLRIGGQGNFRISAISDETLPQSIVQHIADSNPPVVVIVVLPKGGFAQARYLCQSIRDGGYAGEIVVACMGRFKRFDSLFVKFRKRGATCMTTSYVQTKSKIESLLARSPSHPDQLASSDLQSSAAIVN